ncbi:FdtA/QdtA family cupin domain-containing protein [Exiguobacterium sp. s193]|uniref:sugar 3,4-ketoisomerase n=1 Tax=Exiguobacterium sp. s193 TaxID=2751207 RepID=UPI001BE91947|nr:FdtA/QdtA family cupin domain-containing protein [Exiguobacterium sp. s193]
MKLTDYKFNKVSDSRGELISIENNMLSFEMKRVYLLKKLKTDLPRGFHAHKKLKQIIFCIQGECSLILDDGQTKSEILLNDNQNGILIDRMIWHEMLNFTDDCILMVLADDVYNESDYIRNYEEFLKELKSIESKIL